MILILDYGSQYTLLIARRVREMGVYSEVWPCNDARVESQILAGTFERELDGIILSGGPASVTIEGAPESLTDLLRTLVVAPIAKNRRYRLPVGVYQLRVSRAGYVTDVRELRVEPGTRDVSVPLRPQ